NCYPQQRATLLQAIGEYARVSDQKQLSGFFQNVIKKLLAAAAAGGEGEDAMEDGGTSEEIEEKKALMMELALALMPALDDASAEFLFKVKP
ncbi:hypothetical protein T484DRAFT_1792701, partial [Baffinella frigidus]